MRDPKRIRRMCELIEKVWNEYPDQRLGQLLENYGFGYNPDSKIFYLEDDKIEKNLTTIIKYLSIVTEEKK